MGLRLKIILNPSSGRETARSNVENVLSYLAMKGSIERADINYTAKRFDAMNYAMDTDPEEYDILIAAGGDGTVNEVVTGLMRAEIDIPVAIYNSGTVNDFATINRLPSAPQDFARMLEDPELIRVDCGKAGESYFMNVLAAGSFAAALLGFSRSLESGRHGGEGDPQDPVPEPPELYPGGLPGCPAGQTVDLGEEGSGFCLSDSNRDRMDPRHLPVSEGKAGPGRPPALGKEEFYG